jgi:hypothetical protein
MNRFLAATTLVLLAAPGFADGVYIGKIDGGPPSARIALVAAGNRFVCYCCSDDAAFNSRFSRWLTGSIRKSGEATASSADLSLHTSVAGEVLRGGLQTDDGESFEFHGKRVADDSDAGLFRFVQLTEDERLVDGWIVDEDGNVVGDQKANKKKTGRGSKKGKKNDKVGAKANGSSSAGEKKAGASVGSAAGKKNNQVLSSKKLAERLPSIKKGKSEALKGISKKETASKKESESKKDESEKTSKKGPDKDGVAKNETKKPNKNKTGDADQTGDKKVAKGQKLNKGETAEAGENEEEGAVAKGKKKKDGEKEGVAAKGQKGPKNPGKNKKNQTGEADENVQEQVVEKAGQKLLQKKNVGKIKNVEEVNIIEQDDAAAAEEEEAPQPVDVENVRIVNRIKPNNQPGAKKNQGDDAPAPLPGEVVEGNLVGVDDEDRVLTVDDGQDVVEIPVGNRQMIVVDENGERAAEEPANAAAQGALKGKPGQMLKKLAADGEVPVRIRIGAKNVVVKQQAADAQ